MNADEFKKAKKKFKLYFGEGIAFQSMYSTCFALHTKCKPAFNQNPLKRDWSVLPGLQTEKKQYVSDTKIVSLPKNSAFICRYCL